MTTTSPSDPSMVLAAPQGEFFTEKTPPLMNVAPAAGAGAGLQPPGKSLTKSFAPRETASSTSLEFQGVRLVRVAVMVASLGFAKLKGTTSARPAPRVRRGSVSSGIQ